MKYKEQRVGVFIDVQNLYHSAKHLFQARVNFKELVRNLVAGRRLIRAIAYVVQAEGLLTSPEVGASIVPKGREAAFFDALKQAGIELRMKDIQIFPGGMKKADWDVGMAVDAIRMSDFLDAVILVSGDSDFVPLIDYLKWGKGRVVEVAAFTRSASSKVKEVADEFIGIEDLPKILIKK